MTDSGHTRSSGGTASETNSEKGQTVVRADKDLSGASQSGINYFDITTSSVWLSLSPSHDSSIPLS